MHDMNRMTTQGPIFLMTLSRRKITPVLVIATAQCQRGKVVVNRSQVRSTDMHVKIVEMYEKAG